METNLWTLAGGVAVLVLAGFAWTYEYLRRERRQLKDLEKEIFQHWERRRDTIPYAIESYRGVVAAASFSFESLIQKRAEAREARGFHRTWQKEEELEAMLEEWLEQAKGQPALGADIGWLEALSDIQQENEAINRKEGDYLKKKVVFENRLQKFPFMVFKSADFLS